MEQPTNPELGTAGRRKFHPALSVLIYVIGVILLTTSLSGLVAPLVQGFSVGVGGRFLLYIIAEFCLLIAVVGMAWFMLRFVEHRPFSDLGLSWRRRGKDVSLGLLSVVVIYAVGFGFSLVGGAVQVVGVQFHPSDLLFSLFFFVLVAFAEEILVRGYILEHLLHTSMNKFLALLLSSLVFATGHLFNPGIAFLPLLNLVLAGLLLGSSFLYTRNLWFPISFHLFWNWIQGPVLGYEVSGNRFGASLLTLHFPESTPINGGAFGFEGSLVCTFLLLIATGGIIGWFERKKVE